MGSASTIRCVLFFLVWDSFGTVTDLHILAYYTCYLHFFLLLEPDGEESGPGGAEK
jgi:hypothetical protein